MNVVRTIGWIVTTAILVAFIAMNMTSVPVNFWPLNNGNYLHLEWPVGVVALMFFILGMVPIWLYLRAVRWRMTRRIDALERSLQGSSMPTAPKPATPSTDNAVAAPTSPLTAPVIPPQSSTDTYTP